MSVGLWDFLVDTKTSAVLSHSLTFAFVLTTIEEQIESVTVTEKGSTCSTFCACLME